MKARICDNRYRSKLELDLKSPSFVIYIFADSTSQDSNRSSGYFVSVSGNNFRFHTSVATLLL
jgi:hypothetical protein